VFLFSCVVLAAIVLVAGSDVRLPDDNSGFSPKQPIAFSHLMHAGEMGIACLYCHYGAQTSAVAGIPAASICMNCHKVVRASWNANESERRRAKSKGAKPIEVVSKELKKLYRSLGLDGSLKPIPGLVIRPIPWVRIYDLPDFVYFDHRAHVSRGVACETCHGPIETMDRVRQVGSLSMGWCIKCHRINVAEGQEVLPPGLGHPEVSNHVSTDCSTCHF